MAHMYTGLKNELMPQIKEVLKKYNVKATFRIRNHLSLIATIKSAPFNFMTTGGHQYDTINPYWIEESYDGKAKEFLLELTKAMNMKNWDNSDIMVDFFDVGYYIGISLCDNFKEVPSM